MSSNDQIKQNQRLSLLATVKQGLAKKAALPINIPIASDRGRNAWKQMGIASLVALLGGGTLGAGAAALRKKPQINIPPAEAEVQLPVKMAIDYLPHTPADLTALPTPPNTIPYGGKAFWKGVGARNAWENPWTYAGVGAAGLTGLLGGSALVNYIKHKKQKAEQQKALEGARKNFELTLSPVSKAAEALDRLTKAAFSPGQVSGITGVGVAGAGLLAALAARGGYKYMQGRQQEELMNNALKHKAFLDALSNPPAVHVTPRIVDEKEKAQ